SPRLGAFRYLAELLFQLPKELLRSSAQTRGHVHLDQDMQVTSTASVEPGEPLAAHRDHRSRLRPRLHRHGHARPVGQLDGQVAAEARLGEGHFAARPDVVAVPLEAGLRAHFHVDVEIAGGRSRRSGHALPRDPQTLPAVDPRREAHEHLAGLLHVTSPMTGLAGLRDDLTRALTARAGRTEHDEAALGRRLPRAATGPAGGRLGARAGAAAVAGLTGRLAADRHLLLAADHRLFEGDGGLHTDVLAAIRPAPSGSAEPATSEAPEEVGEHVLEVAEDVAHPRAGEVEAPADARVTETVVLGALFLVGQDAEGLRGLLELRFGLRIVLVAIRMKLERELAVGPPDLVLLGVPSHAQDFVIVAFFAHELIGPVGGWAPAYHPRSSGHPPSRGARGFRVRRRDAEGTPRRN